MSEEWRAIPGYEGSYEVSNLGRVRSLDRTIMAVNGPRRYKGKTLHPHLQKGYPFVRLQRAGKHLQIAVHRLVAGAFIGPRPDNLCVNHRNGVKTDNTLANLEYVTPQQNGWHAWRTGLVGPHKPRNHYEAVKEKYSAELRERRHGESGANK